MNISFNTNMANLGNIKVRRRKFGVGSLVFLVLIGLVFTATGALALKMTKIDPSWTRVSGKVTSSSSHTSSGSTAYAPVVEYEVDGQSYSVASSTSSSFYPQIGASRQVAYNPNQPQEAKVVDGVGAKWFVYLFPAIGIGLLILSPVMFVKSLRRGKAINSLMQTGQKLQGILVDVQALGSNNNMTYKIVVSATDNSSQVQNYVSDSISGIGGLAMADFRTSPIPIDVYIDPTEPSKYYVDVSDIPNLTPERISELVKSALNRQPQKFAQSDRPNSTNPPTTI